MSVKKNLEITRAAFTRTCRTGLPAQPYADGLSCSIAIRRQHIPAMKRASHWPGLQSLKLDSFSTDKVDKHQVSDCIYQVGNLHSEGIT